MHGLIVPILPAAHAGKAHRLVGLLPVAHHRIGVGDHPAPLQPLPNGIRLNKADHKTDGQRFALKRYVDRDGNNHTLIRAVGMENGDLRLGERMIVKAVFVNVRLRARGSVDQAVGIHKSKLIQLIELLHAGLIGFQVRFVAEIFPGHQIDGDADRLDLVRQVVFHNLFPAARQLV